MKNVNCMKEKKRKYKMSLDKAIEHKKEKRKQYRGSKSFDSTCRNHGGCPWCEENRLYKNKKRIQSLIDKMKEIENEK